MNVRLASGFAIVALIGAASLAACGSRNSLGYTLDPHLIPSPDPLNLSGTGASHAGQIVATDNGYAGTLEVSTTCTSGTNPVAQVSPLSGSQPLTVTVTPQNTGSCTVTFSDSNGLTHADTVNVTTSGIGVTSRSRK